MKVFTSTSFKGLYPVGTAAVIVAESKEQALELLVKQLQATGLYSEEPFNRRNDRLTVDNLVEVPLDKPSVDILNNGDY